MYIDNNILIDNRINHVHINNESLMLVYINGYIRLAQWLESNNINIYDNNEYTNNKEIFILACGNGYLVV